MYGVNPNTRGRYYHVYAHTSAIRYPSNSYPIHSYFTNMSDSHLPMYEAPKKMKLLVDSGALLYPNLFLDSLKQNGFSTTVLSLFCKVWENLETDIDKSYIKGATAGALNESGLIVDIGNKIGFFFNRKVGGHLAQTCKKAALWANEEQHKVNCERMASASMKK